jgi:hypothetical protein
VYILNANRQEDTHYADPSVIITTYLFYPSSSSMQYGNDSGFVFMAAKTLANISLKGFCCRDPTRILMSAKG